MEENDSEGRNGGLRDGGKRGKGKKGRWKKRRQESKEGKERKWMVPCLSGPEYLTHTHTHREPSITPAYRPTV